MLSQSKILKADLRPPLFNPTGRHLEAVRQAENNCHVALSVLHLFLSLTRDFRPFLYESKHDMIKLAFSIWIF